MKYSKDFLLELYEGMLRIRVCEERLVAPILSGEIKCPVHLCSGQEGISVGFCTALERGDYVFGNHRSHGHYLAKGGSLFGLIAEVFCKEDGCSLGRGGSMHLIDPDVGMLGSAPIVAGTVSLAVGAALASSIRNDGRVAVTFFGDGATNEGVLYEALNLAAVMKLPVLFVCENNLYATHMPIRECRPNPEILRIAEPFDIPGKRVEGNDVVEVYEAAREAVGLCRQGNGPYFLECMTYRLRGHVGPDDNIQGSHTDIRPPSEVEEWKTRDPISRFEMFLLKNRITLPDDLEATRQQIVQEVDTAFQKAMTCPFPDCGGLLEYVFSRT